LATSSTGRGTSGRAAAKLAWKNGASGLLVAVRVDLASVNAGVINNHGFGQFVTFGNQSGSTQPEAGGAVLKARAAMVPRRLPAACIRGGRVPPCRRMP